MRALPLGLPFQGRWLGEAETERLSRICDNLSVCFADSIPTPFVPSGHFPLIMRINSRNRKKDDKRRKKRDSKV